MPSSGARRIIATAAHATVRFFFLHKAFGCTAISWAFIPTLYSRCHALCTLTESSRAFRLARFAGQSAGRSDTRREITHVRSTSFLARFRRGITREVQISRRANIGTRT